MFFATIARSVETPNGGCYVASILEVGKRSISSLFGSINMPRKVPPATAKPEGETTTNRNASQPKLLSGGNPQIPKGDGDVPVQAYIDAMPGWKQDVGRQLDNLISRCVPNVQKAIRWNTPFYGVEGNGWFVAYHCLTKYIKVSFFRGTSLDPVPPVESKQQEVRYFHIHENEVIDEKLVASWIQQAAELPGETCF
jgi:hypothetical protein